MRRKFLPQSTLKVHLKFRWQKSIALNQSMTNIRDLLLVGICSRTHEIDYLNNIRVINIFTVLNLNSVLFLAQEKYQKNSTAKELLKIPFAQLKEKNSVASLPQTAFLF